MNCPRCGSLVTSPPEREWNFQGYHVSRYRCENGDKFNLYAGAKRTFTIPRVLIENGLCNHCKTQNPAHAVYCKNCGTKLSMKHNG